MVTSTAVRFVAEPLVDEVGSGRAGVAVVDADVADSAATRDVGGVGDDGDTLGGGEAVDGLGGFSGVGRVDDNSRADRGCESGPVSRPWPARTRLPEVEPRTHDRRCERG